MSIVNNQPIVLNFKSITFTNLLQTLYFWTLNHTPLNLLIILS